LRDGVGSPLSARVIAINRFYKVKINVPTLRKIYAEFGIRRKQFGSRLGGKNLKHPDVQMDMIQGLQCRLKTLID